MSQKKILTAIDGSQYSEAIVDKAIEYAKLFDAEIILVYCHKKFPTIMGQPYQEEETAHIMSESEKVVGPFLQQIRDSNISVEDRIMEEPAGEAISEIARIEGCDLIIMGSRGLTNLASLIIGSVTNRVLQTAPCSVLVVR
jgi:nucleotide-binding universal stress UspA family protein